MLQDELWCGIYGKGLKNISDDDGDEDGGGGSNSAHFLFLLFVFCFFFCIYLARIGDGGQKVYNKHTMSHIIIYQIEKQPQAIQ